MLHPNTFLTKLLQAEAVLERSHVGCTDLMLIPGLASGPIMVKVFPEPVCPYAIRQTLYPSTQEVIIPLVSAKIWKRKKPANQIYMWSKSQSQFIRALAHNMEMQGDFCPIFFWSVETCRIFHSF